MRILALETATEACSAALYSNGEVLERYRVEPRGHSGLILGMMGSLLDEAGLQLADMDALAFGRGPGSFTGVRIAVGVAQGAAYAADLPLVPVSTLATLAQGAFRRDGSRRVLAAFDARMGEVYWGAFEAGPEGVMAPVCAEAVSAPGVVEPPGEGRWHGVGSGWKSYGRELKGRFGDRLEGVDGDALCRAADLAVLAAAAFARGEAVPPAQALPVYLRDRVTHARPG